MEAPRDQTDLQAVMPGPAPETKLHDLSAELHAAPNKEQFLQVVQAFVRDFLRIRSRNGPRNQEELYGYIAICLGKRNISLSGVAQSSIIINLEDDAGDSTEVQPTNDLDELVLDFVNGLEACLSASSMNGSGISSSPATQALTQALTHCNCHPKYASAAPLAPGEFWYTRAMLDIVGHGQLARDLILSLVVETSYGGRGLRISQDSGASASFISRKMAESLEAKIEPLDPERPVAGPKDHALADMMVAFHTAMLKLRLPCRPGEFQVTFLMVDNLRPGIQAYLSAADASSLGHILILHCERCARAM